MALYFTQLYGLNWETGITPPLVTAKISRRGVTVYWKRLWTSFLKSKTKKGRLF